MHTQSVRYSQYSHLYKSIVTTPHGFLTVFANDNAVKAIDFTDSHPHANENKISKLAAKQLSEYIANQRENFDLPLAPRWHRFSENSVASATEYSFRVNRELSGHCISGG